MGKESEIVMKFPNLSNATKLMFEIEESQRLKKKD